MNESGGFTCEINIFCRTPDGFDAHIKSTEIASDEVVSALLGLSRRMTEEGFSLKGGGTSGDLRAEDLPIPFEEQSKPKPWSAPKDTSKSVAPRCDYCGGETWDNRKNKRNPKAPDFKCKDKDNCGAAAWLNGDELKWAPPAQG